MPDDDPKLVRETPSVHVYREASGDFLLEGALVYVDGEKQPDVRQSFRLRREDARAVAYALLGWTSTIPTEPRRGPTL